MAVDNFRLVQWRTLDAAECLVALADHAKEDLSYMPRNDARSTRWHVTVGGGEFELLCTGSKFWDTRAHLGGGGAIDLTMHMFGLSFKQATKLLMERGL
jgi:hypothetical protein